MANSKIFYTALLLLLLNPLHARELAGLQLPEQISLEDKTLLLNGAGIRSKFVFDIYIGALYLSSKTSDAAAAVQMAGAKRVLMHFLYDEVSREKLTDGWNDGFENNLPENQFKALQQRLEQFNSLFVTVKKGDEILIDYLPGKGTQVTINQQVKGIVSGEDFNQALLRVWLGEEPADEDLKQGMLGK